MSWLSWKKEIMALYLSEQRCTIQLDKPCFVCGGEADCWQHIPSGRICCKLRWSERSDVPRPGSPCRLWM